MVLRMLRKGDFYENKLVDYWEAHVYLAGSASSVLVDKYVNSILPVDSNFPFTEGPWT